MKKILLFFAIVAAFGAVVSSCKKGEDLEALRAEEVRKLKEFLAKNDIPDEPKPSGLYYIETLEGDGDTIRVGDRVQIWYTGMYIDSTVFDATDNYNPFEFIVGSSDVITGMSEGLTYMKQGGKATLIIPSELAYGATNNYSLGVPRFSTLVFDIEVYKHYPAN